jgi:hypothetical protein
MFRVNELFVTFSFSNKMSMFDGLELGVWSLGLRPLFDRRAGLKSGLTKFFIWSWALRSILRNFSVIMLVSWALGSGFWGSEPL